MQVYINTGDYRRETENKRLKTEEILADNRLELQKNYRGFERIMQSKARTAVYLMKNDKNTELDSGSLLWLSYLLSVSNVYLIDGEGNIVNSAKEFTYIDLEKEKDFFKSEDNESLINHISDKPSKVSIMYWQDEESNEEGYFGLCSTAMDYNHIIVLESDADGLKNLNDATTSWKAVLSRNTIGKTGFIFAINDDGEFAYYPDNHIKEMGPAAVGIDIREFKESNGTFMEIDGKPYFCGLNHIPEEEAWVISAIPLSDILGSVSGYMIPMFVIMSVLTLGIIMFYIAYFEEERREEEITEDLGRAVLKRMSGVIAVSSAVVLISSVYLQQYINISSQRTSNQREANTLIASLEQNTESRKNAVKQYEAFMEDTSGIVVRSITDNAELVSRDSLKQLADDVGAKHILIYEKHGNVVASDAAYYGLSLSRDEEAPSYKFRRLLTGTPLVYQTVPDQDYLEKPYLYVGALKTDPYGIPDGFVQLAFDPTLYDLFTSSTSLSTIFSTFSGSNNAFVFSVDKKTNTFGYYPEKSYIGKSVDRYGITDREKIDGFSGFINIHGEEYYVYCRESQDSYVFVAAENDLLTSYGVRYGLLMSVPAIVLFFVLIIIFRVRIMGIEKALYSEATGEAVQAELMENTAVIEVKKIRNFLKTAFFVVAGFITIIVLFGQSFISDESTAGYILSRGWNKGVHIFSITFCMIEICVVGFCVMTIMSILKLLAESIPGWGETVLKMLMSFVKYIAVIGTVFNCAELLGAGTDALLASAGILTVFIGLGSQKLITDVLAGLFIIFEGDFHVGDIINIDNSRGRVLEIGIRNTKLLDPDTNHIMIINNSTLNKIYNLSALPSIIYPTLSVEYGDRIEKLEEIIYRELPVMKAGMPKVIDGPDYIGVDELGDSAVVLKFRISCLEKDYLAARRSAYRELKRMCERNGINIPYPQIVVNQR